jgi:hypothetical protein
MSSAQATDDVIMVRRNAPRLSPGFSMMGKSGSIVIIHVNAGQRNSEKDQDQIL